ncbi:MAG: DinB family protein [Bacteroidetes bacterium]|nr:DinB family protein [Bacteroidota bacterium]
MNESQRIKKLFFDLYDGNPWTAIKLTDLLSGISAEQAALRPIKNANTIWQLVQHCVGWRENVLRKIQGDFFKSPEDNYLSNPPDTSPRSMVSTA